MLCFCSVLPVRDDPGEDVLHEETEKPAERIYVLTLRFVASLPQSSCAAVNLAHKLRLNVSADRKHTFSSCRPLADQNREDICGNPLTGAERLHV